MNLENVNSPSDLVAAHGYTVHHVEVPEATRTADELLDEVFKLAAPEAKELVLRVVDQLRTWHEAVAHESFENGQLELAHAWSADAVQLKAAYHLLRTVELD